MASGLFEYLEGGTETKPIHAGWAAHAGVVAARLAAFGAQGPSTVLEGRFGLFASYFDQPDPNIEQRLDDLGTVWETSRVAYKPYPACHFVHSCVDAARRLRARHSLDADDILHVSVGIPEPGVSLVVEPPAYKQQPRTPYDAKFSLQYSVASMLVRGRVDVSTFRPDAIAATEVLDLARRISYTPGEFPTFPAAFPGRVEIILRDGTTLTVRRSPINPAAIAIPSRQTQCLRSTGQMPRSHFPRKRSMPSRLQSSTSTMRQALRACVC